MCVCDNENTPTDCLVVTLFSKVNEESILAIQIFDQKKFKKKDQGFLGVINVRIGDVIDLQMGGDGTSAGPFPAPKCFLSRG